MLFPSIVSIDLADLVPQDQQEIEKILPCVKRRRSTIRIGDIKVEQAYLLLEQGRQFARQGMKQMANKRKLSAQEKLAEARNVYQNEALFNPAPVGFPRTEFTRFWLAQLSYDQGNIRATQENLKLFLDEFSNNRGDLRLGDNALFVEAICQSDQGNYVLARETFHTIFTLKHEENDEISKQSCERSLQIDGLACRKSA